MSIRVYPRATNSKVYAHKGEKTYCVNGHWVGTFAHDVRSVAYAMLEDFILAPGVVIGSKRCPECECPIKMPRPGGYFFEGAGWSWRDCFGPVFIARAPFLGFLFTIAKHKSWQILKLHPRYGVPFYGSWLRQRFTTP